MARRTPSGMDVSHDPWRLRRLGIDAAAVPTVASQGSGAPSTRGRGEPAHPVGQSPSVEARSAGSVRRYREDLLAGRLRIVSKTSNMSCAPVTSPATARSMSRVTPTCSSRWPTSSRRRVAGAVNLVERYRFVGGSASDPEHRTTPAEDSTPRHRRTVHPIAGSLQPTMEIRAELKSSTCPADTEPRWRSSSQPISVLTPHPGSDVATSLGRISQGAGSTKRWCRKVVVMQRVPSGPRVTRSVSLRQNAS